jgi:hypothetical protein
MFLFNIFFFFFFFVLDSCFFFFFFLPFGPIFSFGLILPLSMPFWHENMHYLMII